MSKEQNVEKVVRNILIESTQLRYYDREFYIQLINREKQIQEDIKNFLNAFSELKAELRKNNYNI